jgi:hypothetical protein
MLPIGSLALLLFTLAAGCGYVGNAPPQSTPNGTPAGTYAIIVTATPAAPTPQPVTITLIVK